ncbi:hypothetical protein [Pseudomonas vanderleydeniana]|uniref:Uncharacterized protein n=1 Tax=Pseudomonas vanderleydeniana TaxID=2745495 RepID=A0A9E6PIQ3_9PSED|nr:hypothetical protein [Pseudomonas vanderleydeniana]QXI26995.1 hypothetical protein HU752_024195 [Pseudomonas vanderleydeniana]
MTPPSFLLTSPNAPRHFVLLDQNGICLAFKSCRDRPQHGNWVGVEEVRLAWLHHPLPAHARRPQDDQETP